MAIPLIEEREKLRAKKQEEQQEKASQPANFNVFGEEQEEFFLHDIPKPAELIPDLLFRDSVMVLGAASKAGKTWMLLNLAASLAFGKPWLGFPTNPARVLYIGFELRRFSMQKRLQQICRTLGVDYRELRKNFTITNRKGFPDNDPDHIFEYMRARLAHARDEEKRPFGMVILDPIYCMLVHIESEGEVENSNQIMGGFGEKLKEFTKDYDLTIAMAHHHRKGDLNNVSALDSVTGAGVNARLVDFAVNLKPIKGEKNLYKVIFDVRDVKQPDAIVVERRDDGLLVPRPDLSAEDDEPKKTGRPSKADHDAYIRLLLPDGLKPKEWFTKANALFDIADKTFRTHKTAMFCDKWIELRGGKIYATILWKLKQKAAGAASNNFGRK